MGSRMKESFLGKSKIMVSLGLRGLPGYRVLSAKLRESQASQDKGQ